MKVGVSVALLSAAVACNKAPDPGTACPAGTIATASGCLPEQSARDAGPNNGRDAATDAAATGMDALKGVDAAQESDANPLGVDASADGSVGTDAGTDAGGLDAAPLVFDINGTWGLQFVTSQNDTDTLFGTGTINVNTYLLVNAQQAAAGETVAMTMHVCRLAKATLAGYATSYPESAIAAYPPMQWTATLSGTSTGADFRVPNLVLVLGWHPNGDPSADIMPTDPLDPRIYDADNDTNPGVTIDITGTMAGQQYVVTRDILGATGATVTSTIHIRGTSTSDRDEFVAGASIATLMTQATFTQNTGGTNTFKMVRLGMGGAIIGGNFVDPTCVGLLNNRTNIFR
jgi:hypothetical protein